MTRAAIILRLVRAYWAYRRRVEVPAAWPLRLWVETSTRCNLRCPMCPNKDLPADARDTLDLDLFRKIVDEARGKVNDLYLHHRGEPLTNPALFEMIRLAEAAGLRTRFHTNGALLDADKAEALLDARPSMVSFSVDGFAKEPYEAARPGAVFEKTVDRILHLARRRAERSQRHPYLVVERIRFRKPPPGESPAAIAALRQRFLAAGIDEVIEKEEYDWTTPDAPEAGGRPRLRNGCTFPWYAMVICADGAVTPCPQDFWARMKLGDVRAQTLEEIWRGEPYRALRRALRDDIDGLELCRKCDRLRRKTVGDVPWQYAATFLIDQLLGYGRARKAFGTAERN